MKRSLLPFLVLCSILVACNHPAPAPQQPTIDTNNVFSSGPPVFMDDTVAKYIGRDTFLNIDGCGHLTSFFCSGKANGVPFALWELLSFGDTYFYYQKNGQVFSDTLDYDISTRYSLRDIDRDGYQDLLFLKAASTGDPDSAAVFSYLPGEHRFRFQHFIPATIGPGGDIRPGK